MENRSIYEDIAARTDSSIYIGVVGPVRTGKSTFIKSFMETMVLPRIDNVYLKERAKDELPQSGSGRTIMTAEPKFVPEEAVQITLGDHTELNVRLIDCVGYMIDGALGQMEGDSPRMVSTPWFDHEVSLREAAETGTQKVINEHSTIGIVMTTDGTISDIAREEYIPAEERVISELKQLQKPFVIVLNSVNPAAPETQKLRASLQEKYQVSCMSLNCAQLSQSDIEEVLQRVLAEFPAKEFHFTLPSWINALAPDCEIRRQIYDTIYGCASQIGKMRDVQQAMSGLTDCEYVQSFQIPAMNMGEGIAEIQISVDDAIYYRLLSEQSGITVKNAADFMPLLCELASIREQYGRIQSALDQVQQTGYGIVMPSRSEMTLEEPEIVRQGGRFGVRLKASGTSIHMIRADIKTEVSPIVGSEKQSQELVQYLLSEFEDSPEKIWESNIFGKSLHELVNEGINNKLYKMPEDARIKIQETLQRIVNESSNGLICIIL
ncbi:stage IV sporulation protein A [Acidaminobacterium chupaoyuni]